MNKRKIVALALSAGFIFTPVAQSLATEDIPAGVEADGKEEQDLLREYIEEAEKEEKNVSLLKDVKEMADPILEARLLEVYGLDTDVFILNQAEELGLDLEEPVSVDEFVKLLKEKDLYIKVRATKLIEILEKDGLLTEEDKEKILNIKDLVEFSKQELSVIGVMDKSVFLERVKEDTIENIKKDELLSDEQKEGYIEKVKEAKSVSEILASYENVETDVYVNVNKALLKENVGNLDFEVEGNVDDLKTAKDVDLFIDNLIDKLANKDKDTEDNKENPKEDVLPGYATETEAEFEAIKALKEQSEYDSYDVFEDEGRFFYKLRKTEKAPENPKDKEDNKPSDVEENTETKVDKSKLEEAISKADYILKDVEKGTVEKRDVLSNKLLDARRIKDNEDSTQEEVNKATEELDKAIAEIYKTADKSELEKMIKAADEVLTDVDKGSVEDRQALMDSLEKARNVNANDNASQEEVDEATKELKEAILKVDPENKIAAQNAKTGVIGLASVGVLLATATGAYIYNTKKE